MNAIDDDVALVEQMGDAIVTDGHWVRIVAADDAALIKRLRSCGRAAGRQRGVKVMTHVTPPGDSDVDVWVVRNERVSEADEIGRRRMEKRIRAAVDRLPSRSIDRGSPGGER